MSDLIPTDQLDPSRHAPTVFLASLAKGSQRTMLNSLRTLADVLSGGTMGPGEIPWHEIRYSHAEAIRARLLDRGGAPATIRRHMAALRGVLKHAWLLGQIPHDEYAKVLQVQRVVGERLLPGRALAYAEIHALLRVCQEDHRPIGVRDAAMITVLYDGLLRRHEIVKLTLDDCDRGSRTLRFVGKRNKERKACLSDPAMAPLECWLDLRGQNPGALFWPIEKAGRLVNRHLAPASVRLMLLKRAKESGIKPCTPHDLRRTGISDMLDIPTVDAFAVSAQAGHADPSTTTRYDRREDRAKMRAAEGLHIPWERPDWVDEFLGGRK